MNRRKFLAMLGMGAATTKLAPVLKLLPATVEDDVTYYRRKHEEAGPSGWVSYRVRYITTLPASATAKIRYIEFHPSVAEID